MAGKKFLRVDTTTSFPLEVAGVQSSAGAANAGDIPALNAAGQIDSTMFPAGLGMTSLTVLASEALAAGAMVSVWNNAGVLNARNANATDATKPADGFVDAAVASGSNATVFFPGQMVSGLSALTIGAQYFLGITAGAVVTAAPAASGNLVQIIGKAVSATQIIFEPEIVAIRA